MLNLPPVCAACMGVPEDWVIYDGGLLVHADPECEQYARRMGKKPTIWRGKSEPLPVNDGRCHYCGKNAWGSKYMAHYKGRDFCHRTCAEGWDEDQRQMALEIERARKRETDHAGAARVRARLRAPSE